MPITTESELRQFLSLKDIPCHEINVIVGGSTNFCWRIKTLEGKQSIIKHAEPFIRIMPDIPLSLKRIGCEHLALTVVPNMALKDEYVRVPQVHIYFPEEHIIHMFDAGSKDLKETYKTNEIIDIPLLGRRIGIWLARLHKETSEPETLEFIKSKFNGEFAKFVFQYTYSGVASVLKKHGYDPALGERINAKFGSETASDKPCLCHGDFWPSNIQLEDQDSAPTMRESDEIKLRAPVLTIIDWENVHIGNGATDVGRFAADSWLLDRFHGNKGMFKAFLTTYLAERPLDQDGKIRLVVHFAVNIIFYSRMKWTDEEGTRDVVQIGKAMLEAVDTGDLESLVTGPLGLLFSQ